MPAESVKKIFFVAFALCVVCSVLVSSAAVIMKPRQIENKALDIKKNLLMSSGLLKNAAASKQEIDEAYTKIHPIIVDLATGTKVDGIDPAAFDMYKASNDPAQQHVIPPGKDSAKIRVRAKLAQVYLVKEARTISQLVLPVHGKGLYSTLYGFLALNKDTQTVEGFAFYQHGETPGLGGEVDNPNWKAQWVGKKVFDAQGKPSIQVVKGGVNPAGDMAVFQVDAISGATMTSQGVQNLLKYWLSEDGYGLFLQKFRSQGGTI